VKSVSRNISLPTELDAFVQYEVEAGGFGTVSEYFRELLRQRRQAQVEQDVQRVEHAMAGAPEGDPDEKTMREIYRAQKRVRARRHRQARR
jgi:putative addiction module CopG family antidote